MTKSCHHCGKQTDLRPYGPKGEWVCFDCAFSTPERKAATMLAASLPLIVAADELARENDRMREALRRMRAWGGFQGYDSGIALGVLDWMDGGMVGELPALPKWARLACECAERSET